MKKSNLMRVFNSTSADSFFLLLVRMVTLLFGILITRVVSEHFSLQEYGTYSQVLLLITTVTTMTTFGLIDGVNFFFCKEKDEQKRNAYISTIFFLHYSVGIIVSLILLCCTVPISQYFENESLKSLIIFAATLPILQNSTSLLQVMFFAIGKAKAIAIRNFLVSLGKLLAMVLACFVFDNIVILLFCQLLIEIFQVVYFFVVLRKNNCIINVFRFDKSLIQEILKYSIPMAMFAIIKSLNRDADKFVISFFTNTETLAVYSNASKLLPFDIVMASFVTVLVPYITRYVSEKQFEKTRDLYKAFLEISFISTGILAIGAVCVAPEVVEFLYSEKYASVGFAVPVFIVYTLVDVISVLNITLILCAAGRTRMVFLASIGAFAINILLNICLFFAFGEIGPALATLLVTLGQGVVILSLSAKAINARFFDMFNKTFLCKFLFLIIVMALLILGLRHILLVAEVHSMIRMIICYGLFAVLLMCMNFSSIQTCLQTINRCKSIDSDF